MGVTLLGVKKIHSNKKDRDYYMLQIAFPGDQGCGKWVDQPFCEKSAFDMFRPEMSGKEVNIKHDYKPGSATPVISGFELIK